MNCFLLLVSLAFASLAFGAHPPYGQLSFSGSKLRESDDQDVVTTTIRATTTTVQADTYPANTSTTQAANLSSTTTIQATTSPDSLTEPADTSPSASNDYNTTTAGATTTTTGSDDEFTPKAVFSTTTDSSVSKHLSLVANLTNSWQGGMQVNLIFTNNDSTAVCSATFSMTLQSGQIVTNIWNTDAGASSTEYKLPSWVNIAPGSKYVDTGMIVNTNNNDLPTISLLSYGYC